MILAVLSEKVSVAHAARIAGVTEQAVRQWRRSFVDAGAAVLDHRPSEPSDGEAVGGELETLRAENRTLRSELAAAHLATMAWRLSAKGEFADADVLEGMRAAAGMSTVAFCNAVGISERTWHALQARVAKRVRTPVDGAPAQRSEVPANDDGEGWLGPDGRQLPERYT